MCITHFKVCVCVCVLLLVVDTWLLEMLCRIDMILITHQLFEHMCVYACVRMSILYQEHIYGNIRNHFCISTYRHVHACKKHKHTHITNTDKLHQISPAHIHPSTPTYTSPVRRWKNWRASKFQVSC